MVGRQAQTTPTLASTLLQMPGTTLDPTEMVSLSKASELKSVENRRTCDIFGIYLM